MSGVTLTMKMLREARDLMMKEPEPTECPNCKDVVSNYSIDILYIGLRGEIGCYECILTFNAKHMGIGL